jgi:ATP-dependent DNA helicase PIF1
MDANLTTKQLNALKSIQSGKNVFLTGPAGSGKSYLLKYFIDWYKENNEDDNNKIFITSTTGLSALIIDGMTINRYSGIGIGDKDVEDYYRKIIKMSNLKKRWCSTSVLIIDEISMMDPDIFDKLEILSRKIRKNDEPFGGIQIILSGDFLQLPPVKSSSFCYESFSWDSVINETFYFNKILRQSDTKLQNILNSIRVGIVNDEVKSVLNECLNKDLEHKDGIIPTLLFSKKSMVNNYNSIELEQLIINGNINYNYKSSYEFSKNISILSRDFYKELINSQYNIEDSIILSLHTQVMLTVNMPDHGLANGSRGIIIDFEDEESNIPNPVVRFMDGKVLTIKPYDFTIDEQGDVIKKIQIPLMHSWAITIHKAQGMSLDFVKTDIGSSIFEYGQAYVVLSRIKNIEGLSLLNIDYSKIIAHPKIVKYYEKLKN